MALKDPMGKFWDAIGKVFGFGSNMTDPKQYTIKIHKRLMYRIEAAMEYVSVDERTGEYKDIDPEDQAKLKLHFRKRIFDVS